MENIELEVLRLRSEGMSIREIARALGISKDRVYRILKRYGLSSSSVEQRVEERIRALVSELRERISKAKPLLAELSEKGGLARLRDLDLELVAIESKLRALIPLVSALSKELAEACEYLYAYVPSIRKAISSAMRFSASEDVLPFLRLWQAVYCGDEDMASKFFELLEAYVKVLEYAVSRL